MIRKDDWLLMVGDRERPVETEACPVRAACTQAQQWNFFFSFLSDEIPLLFKTGLFVCLFAGTLLNFDCKPKTLTIWPQTSPLLFGQTAVWKPTRRPMRPTNIEPTYLPARPTPKMKRQMPSALTLPTFPSHEPPRGSQNPPLPVSISLDPSHPPSRSHSDRRLAAAMGRIKIDWKSAFAPDPDGDAADASFDSPAPAPRASPATATRASPSPGRHRMFEELRSELDRRFGDRRPGAQVKDAPRRRLTRAAAKVRYARSCALFFFFSSRRALLSDSDCSVWLSVRILTFPDTRVCVGFVRGPTLWATIPSLIPSTISRLVFRMLVRGRMFVPLLRMRMIPVRFLRLLSLPFSSFNLARLQSSWTKVDCEALGSCHGLLNF